jgi:hypothetical protein
MSRRDLETHHPVVHNDVPPTPFADAYFKKNQWKEGVMMLLEEVRDAPENKGLQHRIQQAILQMVARGEEKKTISDLLNRWVLFAPTQDTSAMIIEISNALENRADNTIEQIHTGFASRAQDQLPH